MDKLPKEVATGIWALPETYDVEVKAKVPEADEYTISNISEHTEQGVELQQKLDRKQPKENFAPGSSFISGLLYLVIILG